MYEKVECNFNYKIFLFVSVIVINQIISIKTV